MRAVPLALALVGCEGSPGDASLVDELRVLALTAEPCQGSPGEPVQITATVADPAGEGAEIALWSCAEDGACSFAQAGLSDARAAVELVPEGPGSLWAVACAPGACDVGTLSEADLRDPADWLAAQPIDGVAAASARLPVAPPGAEPACINPVLTLVPEPEALSVAPGGSLMLSWRAERASLAYSWTTGGRFDAVEHVLPPEADGALDLRWTAPDIPGTVQLYVIFAEAIDDPVLGGQPTGGNAVWVGRVVVR